MRLIDIAKAVDLSDKGQQVQEGLTQKIAEILSFFFGRLPSWIAGVIVFVLAIGVAKMAKRTMENKLAEHLDEDENEAIMILGGRITYVGTLTLGITIALKIAGIDLTTILAAVAFGIGFALRDLIMNFLAGVMILVSKQFVIGDFIKVDGQIGKVEEIQSRATILKAVNGTKLIIPNAKIFTTTVVSYTSNPIRRADIPLSVAYGTDLDLALSVTLDTIKSHAAVLRKPGPSVRITDFNSSSIDLKARFWVSRGSASWLKVRHELINMINKAYKEAGIHIPYGVLHVETETDTKEEWAAEAERAKRTKIIYEQKEKESLEEMNAAVAAATSAESQVPPMETPVVPVVDNAPVATNGNQPVAPSGAAPQLAAETAPIGQQDNI